MLNSAPSAPGLDFHLGETVNLLRQNVADFAAREIAPRAAEIDRENTFPQELWQRLGELGLLGVTIDPTFGGAGMGYLEHTVAMEEISRASRVGRPLLRRALQPVRKPDLPQRYGGPENAVSS